MREHCFNTFNGCVYSILLEYKNKIQNLLDKGGAMRHKATLTRSPRGRERGPAQRLPHGILLLLPPLDVVLGSRFSVLNYLTSSTSPTSPTLPRQPRRRSCNP